MGKASAVRRLMGHSNYLSRGLLQRPMWEENVIFTLLLYLLLVVSIFGVLILTKLSDLDRGRRKQDKDAEEGSNEIEKQ